MLILVKFPSHFYLELGRGTTCELSLIMRKHWREIGNQRWVRWLHQAHKCVYANSTFSIYPHIDAIQLNIFGQEPRKGETIKCKKWNKKRFFLPFWMKITNVWQRKGKISRCYQLIYLLHMLRNRINKFLCDATLSATKTDTSFPFTLIELALNFEISWSGPVFAFTSTPPFISLEQFWWAEWKILLA